jgi:hypothetical protein
MLRRDPTRRFPKALEIISPITEQMSRMTIDACQIKGVSCLPIVEFGNRQGIAGYMLELAGITVGKNRQAMQGSFATRLGLS